MAKKEKIKLKDSTVSLEIHDDLIKLCEVSYKGKSPVFRLARKPFPRGDDARISQEIADLFKALSIPKKKIFLNIPKNLIMTRFLQLPSDNEHEISSMVSMEAAKQIPYAGEETIVRHKIIEKRKDGYSVVLMSIVQTSIVDRYMDILKNANVAVEKGAIGSESLFKWHEFAGDELKIKKGQSVALINVDSKYIDIDIIQDGILAFARAFVYGGRGFFNSRQAVSEIEKTILTYQREKKTNIGKMVIFGAKNKIKEIEPVLRSRLRLSAPVETVPQVQEAELKDSKEANLDEESYAELIGLALFNEEIKINLLPDRIIEKKEMDIIRVVLTKTFVLAACIIFVLAGLITEKLFSKTRYLSRLEGKIKSLEPRVDKVKKMREDVRLIKEEIHKNPLAIDILSEVYRCTTKGIVFNLMDYESGKVLVLRGNAPSLSRVIKYVPVLEKSPYFENVKIKYTTKRSKGGKQVTEFEIVCVLSRVV